MPNETIFSDCGKLDRLLEGLIATTMAEKSLTYDEALKGVAAQSPALWALRDALRMKRARLVPLHETAAPDAFSPRPEQDAVPPRYYSGSDLCRMFGVNQKTLLSWIEKDLFGEVLVDFLVSPTQVQQFARQHSSEYSLRKANPRQMIELLFARPQKRTGLSLCPRKARGRKERP